VTNWLDPEKIPTRLLLLVLMLAGLVMSASIPQAFEERAVSFACAYVFMQVGRTVYFLWAAAGQANLVANFRRILVWLLLSAAFWLAGAGLEAWRLPLWLAAIAIEFVSPSLGFYVPGLGRSRTSDWNVEGGHLSERCGLFVIIALGESLLMTGATAQKLPVSAGTVTAFVSAFLSTVSMWWLYFAIGAERATHHIAHSADPGRLARAGYTYWHIVIVAGIIVAAVADELVLAHPAGHVATSYLLAIVGAPALFLLGNGAFKWLSAPNFPLSHLVGLALLAAIAAAEFLMHLFSPLGLSIATTGVLIIAAMWEWRSLGGGAAMPAASH